MPRDLLKVDHDLIEQLQSLSRSNEEYWSFRGAAKREHAHGYCQYPAMMVPQMQAKLLDAVIGVSPAIESVYDPFLGSGTTLTESMLHGLDFGGQDINPLAILISRVKSGPFHLEALRAAATDLDGAIRSDRQQRIDADFCGRTKWFRRDVLVALSRIRRSVRRVPQLWARRFFWVALGETVRLTSNSRTSTFKLHIRPQNEITARVISPFGVFRAIVAANLNRITAQAALLRQRKYLARGHYTGQIDIKIVDTATDRIKTDCSRKHDVLLTSPPYGDNKTTVPYGQYSFLPLQWIDLADIGPDADSSCTATSHEIDYRSLGGSRRRAKQELARLRGISPTFDQLAKKLAECPPDCLARVSAFCGDLDRCVDNILHQLQPNAHMIWIAGNRRVGGTLVPMDAILGDLLESRKAVPVGRIVRQIPSKRLAMRNSISATMSAESILVFRSRPLTTI